MASWHTSNRRYAVRTRNHACASRARSCSVRRYTNAVIKYMFARPVLPMREDQLWSCFTNLCQHFELYRAWLVKLPVTSVPLELPHQVLFSMVMSAIIYIMGTSIIPMRKDAACVSVQYLQVPITSLGRLEREAFPLPRILTACPVLMSNVHYR